MSLPLLAPDARRSLGQAEHAVTLALALLLLIRRQHAKAEWPEPLGLWTRQIEDC